jgi:sporulation protein YlmC with PRC-barrel domain
MDLALSQEVVRKTVAEFGSIDIFIDYWLPPARRGPAPETQTHHTDNGDGAESFMTIDILTVVLKQMVETNNLKNIGDREIKSSYHDMLVGIKLINKPILSVKEGKELGKVQDLYLVQDLKRLQAIYLGGEGILTRTRRLINLEDVVTMGEDAILVKDAECV